MNEHSIMIVARDVGICIVLSMMFSSIISAKIKFSARTHKYICHLKLFLRDIKPNKYIRGHVPYEAYKIKIPFICTQKKMFFLISTLNKEVSRNQTLYVS